MNRRSFFGAVAVATVAPVSTMDPVAEAMAEAGRRAIRVLVERLGESTREFAQRESLPAGERERRERERQEDIRAVFGDTTAARLFLEQADPCAG